ncbi:uncharacterized protein LOC135489958 [Lineus longissimus]|uniref:uncharacterized protein LOC135489958 n=1 Tax=Lineus longissimus TaxID=88925 RepID=UPI00315C64BB
MDESAPASTSTTACTGTSGKDDPEIIHPPGTGSGTAGIDLEAATIHQDSPASPLVHAVKMGCKKRLFDHGPSAERVQGMTCNTNKKEIAKLNETIDKLEAAKDELQENLQVKDDDYDNLYRQYTNLTYNSAIRDEHHKRCTHLRLSSQVSAYTSRQVSEAIFSQTFYEPDPDIDNVFVPYITVELQGHL